MRSLAILISIFFLFNSCDSNKKQPKIDKLTFTNDCESLEGWNNNLYPVSTTNFHSGRYSNIVGNQSPYSVTFRYKYGDLSKKELKGVKISVWTYYLTTNMENKSLIVEIDSSGTKQFWLGVVMKEFVKSPKTWTKIEKEIIFPRKFDSSSIIGIYVSNPNEDNILLDDFKIQFIEK